MSDRAFLEIWSLSFSDFGFLKTYHQGSRAWVGVQLLYFRDHGHFAEELDEQGPVHDARAGSHPRHVACDAKQTHRQPLVSAHPHLR